MTDQEPNTFSYGDDERAVLRFIPSPKLPRPDLLGFHTKGESTANWSGYLNHYCIRDQRLHLKAMTVNLAGCSRDFTPERAVRRSLNGRLQFYFEDFPLRFTGKISLEDSSYLGGLKLIFVKGVFISECPFSIKVVQSGDWKSSGKKLE